MKHDKSKEEEMTTMKNIQTNLIAWYKKEARDLPWRNDSSPYKVWISEMMLQQTRVDTVIPYFIRFIDEVPTIKDLAVIEEDKLLKLWQGLGYYNRALNLRKAARIILEKYEGTIPRDMKELMTLPGIGPYSAGAIASIAFGERVPSVDGNVLRVITRIIASKEDIGDSKVKSGIESFVVDLLPLEKVGDFNQALMDLGAVICLPNGEPKCTKCPVSDDCKAYNQGIASEIPVKAIKKKRRIEKRTILIISFNGKFALRKRKGGELLPNLWEFPNFDGYLTERQCENLLSSQGMSMVKIRPLEPSKHIFTHLEWHMKGFFVEVKEDEKKSDYVWASKKEINDQYSIPTAFKSFLKMFQEE